MWYKLKKDEVVNKLRTNINVGLTEQEVKKRQKKYGENDLKNTSNDSIIIKFFRQFNDFMIITLIIASIVSAIVSYMQNSNDYFDCIIIIGIVLFNAIMGLVQEEKAEKAIDSLKKLTPQLAKVIRNGKVETINAKELVPGDILLLEAGNNVPADCRIIESAKLKTEESNLTGEAEPVEKNENEVIQLNNSINNIAFMSTTVISGHAKAIVTKTGMNTNVGKIANMMIENKSPETPIQKKLSEVGKLLGISCLIICLVIFIIGLLRKINPIEMFMTSVGLAVAAIPEGLPAIVTIVLSIGVTKMAKKNCIVRKLPAVEALGSSNVICSDKTGTLTKNMMEVVKVKSSNKKFAIELCTMCTDSIVSYDRGKRTIQGEPTEVAIVKMAIKMGIDKNELYNTMSRIADIPFDSTRKMMTTIHKLDNKYRIITKGAPDVLLNNCTKIYKNSAIHSLNNTTKKKILSINENLASKSLRVIGVSYVDLDFLPFDINSKAIEKELIFVGLIGMIDPPRDGVKEAVNTCLKAGIKPVMITGDHIATAKSIAKSLNILQVYDKAITGAELDNINQKDLEKNIHKYSVFARVSPEHKVRIIKAWQSTGAIVAMTGDGVNDSPALKSADIGIAMGKTGTDVAKNAADIILTDDNFVTIVEAISQGRTIYDNIKKAVHFLISTNIGEIVAIFIGLLLGIKSPLLAVQLLWINLITDSIPAIALGLEPSEKYIMSRKSLDSKKTFFSDGLWWQIIIEGFMIGVLTLFAFNLGNVLYNIEVARTMAFLSLGILELVHSFNIKSEQSVLNSNFANNKYLIGSFVLGVLVQVIVVIVPFFAKIFSLVPLNSLQWIYVILISILPIPIMEFQKILNEYKNGKIIYSNCN